MKITIKTLAVTSIACLAIACGDDEEENGNNSNNNEQPPASLQQEAFDAGQIDLADGSGLTLDPNTLAVSGVVPASPATSLPAAADPNTFYGAVDPSAADGNAWWQGWTAIDAAFQGNLPGADFHPLQAEIEGGNIAPAATNACTTVNADFADGGTVDVFGETFPVCIISEDITTDTSLVNNHVFVLANAINVGDGGQQNTAPTVTPTLTIPAGTQIYAGGGDDTALIVTRGADIVVNGTEDQPVIMAAAFLNAGSTAIDETDVQDDGSGTANRSGNGQVEDLASRGQWGGLIIDGFGIVNSGDANGEVASEASPPADQRYFGGDDNADDSGSISYLIVAETGFAFFGGAEIQGITLEGTGSGLTLDHVQIIGSDDDCVEWFGGASSMTHLVCNGVNDDALDIDLGYQGFIQYAIIRMGTEQGDRGIESDNNGDNFEQAPVSAPNIANILVLGNSGRDDTSTRGALHREGFAGKVWRSVYVDDTLAGGEFEAGCLDVDDVVPDALEYIDGVFSCTGGTDDGLTNPDD